MLRRTFSMLWPAGLDSAPPALRAAVLISANAEWRPVRARYKTVRIERSPYGECFVDHQVLFFQGGWGKIDAAASTQYVIDRYSPPALINLGTCGGISGAIERGATVLATKTVIYDLIERMGDAGEAIRDYTTDIDLGWLHGAPPMPVVRAPLVSADQDLDPAAIPRLRKAYGAVAADWESGAIARVAARNHVRLLILRSVTDLVSPRGGEAYGNESLFEQRTAELMGRLLDALPGWLAQLD